MAGLREVHFDAERLLDLLELRELLAVVERQGLQKSLRQRREKSDYGARNRICLLRRGICEEHESRHALGQRDEVASSSQAVDEVSLPVAHAGAVLDRLRPFVDVHAPLDLAPPRVAVLLRVPVPRLAPLLALRKRRKGFARLPRHDEFLTPVVLLVERFGAHHRNAVALAAPVDLLERPALRQALHRQRPHPRREPAPLRGLRGGAAVCLALRLLVPVAFLAAVALQLPPDRCGMASDPLRYVLFRTSLFTQRLDYDTLFNCQAVVLRNPGRGLSSFLRGH